MADGKRTRFGEEPSLIESVCKQHGMLKISGTWVHVPNLVAFLASDQKDANITVYDELCDQCIGDKRCCECDGHCQCEH